MPSVVLPIHVSAEDWVGYYRGAVRAVRATSLDGRVIELPAGVLQPFVSEHGVRGVFRVFFDQHYRFVRIERLRGPTRGGRLA